MLYDARLMAVIRIRLICPPVQGPNNGPVRFVTVLVSTKRGALRRRVHRVYMRSLPLPAMMQHTCTRRRRRN